MNGKLTNKRMSEKEIRLEIARKTMRQYYEKFAIHHKIWIKKLMENFVGRDGFNVHTMMLADRYKTPEDQMIALFASLLVRDKGVNIIMQQTNKLYSILTEHPYEWFNNFGYIPFGDAAMRDKLTLYSVRCGQICDLLDSLMDIQKMASSIQSYLQVVMKRADGVEVVKHAIGEGAKIKDIDYVLPLMLIRMSHKKGLGLGIVDIDDSQLLPWNSDVRMFLNTFSMPTDKFSADEKIEMMGFESKSDFFYAYLAYKDLMTRYSTECRRYATTFRTRMTLRCDRENMHTFDMKKILPPIE